MKHEAYEQTTLEIIRFYTEDAIMTSSGSNYDLPFVPDGEEEE